MTFEQIKYFSVFTFILAVLAGALTLTGAGQAYAQVQIEDDERTAPVVDPDIEEIEDDDLRERAEAPPDRFTILEDGTVRIAGVIDQLGNDYFYILNDGERIRVNLEALGNADAISGLMTEGEDVIVTGELMEDSNLVPRIKAKNISSVDKPVQIDVTPDVDIE